MEFGQSGKDNPKIGVPPVINCSYLEGRERTKGDCLLGKRFSSNKRNGWFKHAGCAENRMGFSRDFRCNNLGFSLDGYCVFGMIKTLSNPVFLVCISLANCNQGLEKLFGIFIPVAHSYLDDVLCFPIDLTIGLAAYRLHDQNYKLTAWHIWPVVLFYALYFEWYLP